jgi:hypothetical protein
VSLVVRRATSADVGDMAMSLTAAFDGDPEYLWIYGTASRYRELAPIYFRWRMKRAVAVGSVYLIEGRAMAAVQHSSTLDTDPASSRAVRDELQESHGEAAERLLTRARAYDSNHPMRIPHWYWTVAASRPEGNLRGAGTALVRHVLAVHGNLPMYGETVTPYQASWWKKWGFNPVAEDFDLAPGLQVTPVWREPDAVGDLG